MPTWTPEDGRRVAEELRALLTAGRGLDEAIVTLHRDRKLGVMYLWPAVMAVTGASREEAMRAVLGCTHRLHWGEEK